MAQNTPELLTHLCQILQVIQIVINCSDKASNFAVIVLMLILKMIYQRWLL